MKQSPILPGEPLPTPHKSRHVVGSNAGRSRRPGAALDPREGTPVVDAPAHRDNGSRQPAPLTGTTRPGVRHPLDPLDAARSGGRWRSSGERGRDPEARFVSVTLNEPPKDQVAFPRLITWSPSSPPVPARPPRCRGRRSSSCWNRGSTQPMRRWCPSPPAQSCPGGPYLMRARPFMPAEFAQCEVVTRADPRIRAGLERRGITDPGQVRVEPWGIGTFAAPEEAGPAAGVDTAVLSRAAGRQPLRQADPTACTPSWTSTT